MLRHMIDYQRFIEKIDDWIVNHDIKVVGVFLVFSLILAGGLGMTATNSGTSQFTESVPAQKAFEEVNDNFERHPFQRGTGSTTLIQKSNNVLSKSSILEMLRAQHRLKKDRSQSVVGTNSVAQAIAQSINPNATTLSAQIESVKVAPNSVVKKAAQETLQKRPSTAGLLSSDLNRKAPSASATIATVTHRVEGVSQSTGTQGTSPLTSIQQEATFIVGSTGADITVFGSGLISAELSSVISDSLTLVIPAAVLLILFFLIISYRDPFDLLMGLVCLAMALIWTFGFMGWAGIPFTQMLIRYVNFSV